MLQTLFVKNFAIIEDLKIDFDNAMTVLTGETGAGKSLIIDTISLLLGARADKDMIRYGETSSYIEGVFSYDNPQIDEILLNLNIPKLENLTIKREIGSRNKILVNDVSITITNLKNLTMYLADIHVQHDTFKLINPDTYLSLIDDLSDQKFINSYNKYQMDYSNYLIALKKYKSILNGKKNSLEQLEFKTFQYNEISNINPLENEDSLLESQISVLSNFDKIFINLNEAHKSLDSEYFSIDNIYNAYTNLDKISNISSEYEENASKLSECFYNLEDVLSNIRKMIDNLDFDKDQLDYCQERLTVLNNLKAKYKLDLSQIIELKEELKLQIDMIVDFDKVLEQTYKTLVVEFEKVKSSAIKLSNMRKIKSREIQEYIKAECSDLELPDTNFTILFNDCNIEDPLNEQVFNQSGIDIIDFLISLNKGEPQKPLHKTTSGGEMSRIMLAFKAYFIKKTKVSLIIFDEIDSGVSGEAAYKIALKMNEISKICQVLCITHLPAVASIADNHIFIFKEYLNNRTFTNISKLKYEERIEKIAMMLSGSVITPFALEYAKNLLDNKHN